MRLTTMRSGAAYSLLAFAAALPAWPQPAPASLAAQAAGQVAGQAMARWPQGSTGAAWQPGEGSLLTGITGLWYATADGRYDRYVQQAVNRVIAKDGSVATQDPGLGRQALMLYGVTLNKLYYAAATHIRAQLQARAHTPENPEDLYTAEPFLAEYALVFQQPRDFAFIVQPLSAAGKRLRTYTSRDLGWYAMSLADTLDYIPEAHPRRAALIVMLHRVAAIAAARQDAKSGLWLDGTHAADLPATSMLVYALEKSARRGYLSARYEALGERAYRALAAHSSQVDDANDPIATGTFLLASTEAEKSPTALLGRGKTVLVDAWYNSQVRTNAAGRQESFHYKWRDNTNSGFSFLGRAFRSYGLRTETLPAAPTLAALSRAQIYIIASPDIPSKNPHPHYVAPADVPQLVAWVRHGGVLVMMENDGADAEFTHVNTLMEKFGIHFNAVDDNQVPGSDWDAGKLLIPAGNSIFTPKKIYMKDISSITPTAPARSVLEWQGHTVMAVARLGRGTVYAVVDPWLYNEYTDGRKLPMDYENFGAAKELVRWLLAQVPAARK